MKRPIILFLLLILLGPATSAQHAGSSIKYFNRSDLGYAFGISSFKTDLYDGIQRTIRNNDMILSLQTVNGIMFNDRIGLGAGIGAEMWQHGWFFPLFGQASYFLKPVDNTFFGNVGVGYSFGNRDNTSYYNSATGGLMANVGIGYSREVGKRLRFCFEVFYRYQALQSSYNVYIKDSLAAVVDYKVPLSFIGFRVGVLFK